ncbi:MAG: efflux RND transporter periplasmic adaptor subunit [Candidatus Marinimicrobia bacterium]|nr:efflux RND transporter periplasmic adaptor subunit [Candidatus Neomarinimicrobiota bacterium]MCF7904073.1 efflux RND transporter periplasmic adaptor subunit [Candidatus Neomarinimicrobiota bacterium]
MKFINIILSTLLILTLVTCSNEDATDAAADFEIKAIPVSTQMAEAQTFRSVLAYNGSLLAIQTARIIPEMPGAIDSLMVEIGNEVAVGDVLVQMDISTTQLQYKQAAAGLAVARANLNDASKNWERVQALRKESAVSEQQYEKAKLGLEAAQAQLNQAKAGADLLKMQLNKATLTAPFKGVITQKGFEEGDLFSPAAMMPVYTLQDVSRIKVELQITSEEITKVRKGQKAFLSVDYLEGDIAGEVSIVSVAADPMSKSFYVQCQFDNPDGVLRAGTFGEVDILIDEVPQVVVVPKTAVIDGKYVFTIEDGHAYQQEVSIVKQSLDSYIIGAGLRAGDTYVSSGAYVLKDSSLIKEMN